MDIATGALFLIVFLFFFANRSNPNMRPWVQWVGWGMFLLWILAHIIR